MIDITNNVSFNYLKEYYNSLDLAKVFNIDTMEIKHSNFLKWVLQPSKDNNIALRYFPIRQLLKTIQENINTTALNEEYSKFKNITIDKSKIENVEVHREKFHIDFVITLTIDSQPYVVVIENKLEASERENQLSDYRKAINKNYPNTNLLFVLLHPNYEQLKVLDKKELLKESAEFNNYISITYQNIYDNVLKEYLKVQNDNTTKFILNSYIHTLSCYSNNIFGLIVEDVESENLEKLFNDEEFITTISDIQNNKDTYKEHKAVLLKICAKYRMLKGSSINEELNKVLNKIEKPKIYTFYKIPSKSMAEFVYRIISDIVKTKSIKSEDDFGEALKNWLFGKNLFGKDWNLHQYYEGIEKVFGGILNKDKYPPIKIGDSEYYSAGYVSYLALLELYDLIIAEFPEYKDRDRIEIL